MNGKIKEVIQENKLDKVVTYLGFIKDIDKYFKVLIFLFYHLLKEKVVPHLF